MSDRSPAAKKVSKKEKVTKFGEPIASEDDSILSIKNEVKEWKSVDSSFFPANAAVATSPNSTTVTEEPLKRDVLPIDAFTDEIISRVARDRVIIIHGETGNSIIYTHSLNHSTQIASQLL